MRLADCLVAFAFTAGCARYEVTRLYRDGARDERFIDAAAYRAFLGAAELEERGELDSAREAFQAVLDADPECVEAWTRLGAVECRLGVDAESRFIEAERLDSSYAPLWTARGICARHRGESDAVFVERAFRLDPTDDALLLAQLEALLSRGDAREAFTLAREVVTRSPGSLNAWSAMSRAAKAVGRPDFQREASVRTRRLAELGVGGSTAAREPEDLDALFEALVESFVLRDDAAARSRASKARLSPPEVAAAAILAGRPDYAVELASRVLAAEPTARDMRALGALAADLAAVPQERSRWLDEVDHGGPIDVGPIGAAAFDELMLRSGFGALDKIVREQVRRQPGSTRERWLAERLSVRLRPPEVGMLRR